MASKIGLLEIEIYIEYSHSLKDKRQVVKSILNKTHNQFNVAAAETGFLDVWQRSTLSFVMVSNDNVQVEKQANNVARFLAKDGRFEMREQHFELI